MNFDKMPAGRELDALVAERVMGWASYTDDLFGEPVEIWQDERGNMIAYQEDYSQIDATCERWSPSTDISAAWQVIDKTSLLHDANCLGYDESNSEWIIFEACCPYDDEVIAVGETPELAICRAALKVVTK